MTVQTLPPTQQAYDRIQQAAIRSCEFKDLTIRHELHKEGVLIRASGPMAKRDILVPWSQIALAKVDPLFIRFEEIVEDVRLRAEGAAGATP